MFCKSKMFGVRNYNRIAALFHGVWLLCNKGSLKLSRYYFWGMICNSKAGLRISLNHPNVHKLQSHSCDYSFSLYFYLALNKKKKRTIDLWKAICIYIHAHTYIPWCTKKNMVWKTPFGDFKMDTFGFVHCKLFKHKWIALNAYKC